MGHLDEDALVGHAAGTLAGEAALHAEVHLAECGACRERLERISSLILSRTQANLGSDPHASPPSQRVTEPGGGVGDGQRDTVPARGPNAAAGATFGRYQLLEQLGRGGMGEVYKAKDPQLDRVVALKILRPGSLGNEEGQARLWREAQSMARLSHPNVVMVHDVGRAEDKVYVAMEFIDGESLSQWLRGDHAWPEVLEALRGAGAGLAAAHDAGVVHRDFKPDNVLLGQDGRARVLDFGLARHTSQKSEPGGRELPDVPLDSPASQQLTRDGTVMGTPGYMAPEQLSGLPTDARSDQFSFCVTAWEALYGKRPFGGATLKAHAEQLTSGKLPEPPGDSPVPAWVHRALQRGLSASPEARWPSMHALLAALTPRRRATSRLVALGVGALGLTAAAATFVATQSRERLKLCGGNPQRLAGVWDDEVKRQLAPSFAQSGGLWKATTGALDAYAAAWVAASEETCVRGQLQRSDSPAIHADKTVCLEGLLRQLQAQVRVLSSADSTTRANALRAVRALDPVGQCTDVLALNSRRKDRASTGSKEEEALTEKLRDARALFDSGQYARCAESTLAALQGGGPAWLLADGWLLAGRAQHRAGQNTLAEASFFEAAVNAERAGTADAAARAWARMASVAATSANDYREGRRFARLARATAQRAGLPPELEAEVENADGSLDLAEGNFAAARDHFERALAMQETSFGEHHPETIMTLNNLGVAQSRLGQRDEAVATWRRALASHLETSGPEHPNTASTMHNLAVILSLQGQLSEAQQHAEQALKIREAALGPESPDVATSLQSLAKLYRKLGGPEKSLAALQRALAIRQKDAPESAAVASVYDDLAHFYRDRGDAREALGHAERAIALMSKVMGEENPRTAGTRVLLGTIHTKLGNWEKARAELDRALKLRRQKLGPEHPEVASSLNALGDLELALGNGEAARQKYQAALELREKALGSKDRTELAADWYGLGRAFRALKKPADATAALERAVELREKGEDKIELALARFELAQALWDSGDESHPRALTVAQKAGEALEGEARGAVEKWLEARAAR